MKKWLALLLLPFVLFFSSNAANAADDITGHYFEQDMRELIDLGYLKGTIKDGQTFYEPDRNVTRAEFAAFLVRILEAQNLEVINPKSFSDVKEGAWYYRVVQQAAEMNIVNGNPDGTFKPDAPISREAMSAMMNSAFEYKGIKLPETELKFKDTSSISSWAVLSVKRMVAAGIVKGNDDNTFRPAENATRGVTSAFLVRMINELKTPPPPPPAPNFHLATVTADATTKVKEYETYDAAKAAATQSNHVVLKDNKVVYMKSGVVAPAQIHPLASVLYKTSGFGDHYFSLVAGTETEFLDAGETWVKVKFNNTIGYFKMNEATLHPTVKVKGASYYKAEGGKLTHYTYNVNTDTYGAFWFGSSGSMPDGKYSSKDGHSFSGNGNTYNMYQYFNVMPLYTKTSYTAEQLNDFVKNNKPDFAANNTILENLGQAFKNVEAKYNVNAMYLLSHAIHESGWGTSPLAIDKKNLFGIKAYDGSAYESGDTYKSYEACIEVLVKEYLLDPTSSYFIQGWKANGEVVGDKELGMNVRYAADPYWGQKIAGYMYRIDKYLKGNERNKYGISVTLTDGVNVRNDASASASKLYSIPLEGTPVLVLNKVTSKTNEGTWLQIVPKNLNGANYEKTFVYSHGGPYGTLMRDLPLAK
ncbi:S-layer homology domain-containing protein [Fictibacillus sp. BK138]|uniref:S-layer homology domain-containing protein n=1 Tax=Fictibacillus sp. BK138 TaxID=2512121 RepID=UPI001029A2DE|nr:S-layer homology domain-containing protein [Fictibacillus sp. BK138]RZT21547.1 S-layer family protein [Fictibacillus sp. BK138]